MTKTRNLADLGGGFIQAGTGAVQRTVESKLQDVVSVLDFIPEAEHAAIKAGTSTYDATVPIQAAINYVSQTGSKTGALFVPPGTYRVSSGLTVPKLSDISKFSLLGCSSGNSHIWANNSSTYTLLTLMGGNVLIQGISFSTGTGYTQTCIHDVQQMDDRFTTIRDCTFGGQFAVGVQTDSNATNIDSNSFLGGGIAIASNGPLMNSTIQANYIMGCQKGIVLNKAVSGQQPEGLRILNNTILTANPGIHVQAGLEIYIESNIIDITPANGTGILVEPAAGSSVASVKINKNWISGGTGASGACLTIKSCDNHSVSDCTFVNLDSPPQKPAIILNLVNGIQLLSNIFWSDWTGYGDPVSLTSTANLRTLANYTRYGRPTNVRSDATLNDMYIGPHWIKGAGGGAMFTRSGAEALELRRTTNDGELAVFKKETTVTGSIKTTNSYITLTLHPTINTLLTVYAGDPNGVVTAGPGSLCLRNDGGGGLLYVKQSGSGNTGWVSK